MAPTTPLADHQRHGDKQNSPFFEEYLYKIYTRKEASGLQQLVGEMRAVVIQVEPGEALQYIAEMTLMSSHRLLRCYRGASHNVFIMRVSDTQPDFFILEPRDTAYSGKFAGINKGFARASEKPNVKYIGELYYTKDLSETVGLLKAEEFRFTTPKFNQLMANEHFAFTEISYYTNNMVGYTSTDLLDLDALGLGEPFTLTEAELEPITKAAHAQQMLEITGLVKGLDHLATRVLSGDREHAILEFASLTNYYFWGAYSIDEQNSSTNICRNPDSGELESPAKVFTANNTPYYVNSIVGRPSPTENFVRNFGRRMHHMALAVNDGARPDGTKNIDYVVGNLEDNGIPFLAKIFGECKDIPDLKQIFSKTSPYSFLITEYVQRCHNFQGFFTRGNVAALTHAAGLDAELKKASPSD